MTVLALEFPPIDHLTRWGDIGPGGLNKVGLIYLFAMVATLTLFLVGGSKKQLVPRGIQNIAESSVDFVRNQSHHADDGPRRPRLPAAADDDVLLHLLQQHHRDHPVRAVPGERSLRDADRLALMVWVIFNVVGIAKQGPIHYLKNSVVPPGVPKAILPLVVIIEVVSVFLVRPFSLAVRLFANMLAGHLILVTFSVLCAALFAKSITIVILPFSFALLVGLTGFEILVSFLQAFIFTILAAVYIGSSMHPEH